MTLFTQLGKNNVGTTKEIFNEEGHASCTLKTSFVVPTLFLPNCVKRVMRHVLGKNNARTTKEVFNVYDA
jgi:hypothetical protein